MCEGVIDQHADGDGKAMSTQHSELSMWVIYEKPRDYPQSFVVRRWRVVAERVIATQEFSVHDTLEQAREGVPVWCARIDRDPEDDPVIVESWL